MKLRLALVGLSLWLSLAQPGLCPCWMLTDVAQNHPHPAGDAHKPHGHDYLHELFRANLASTAPQVISAHALLWAYGAAGVWWPMWGDDNVEAASWFAAVPLPPPRKTTPL